MTSELLVTEQTGSPFKNFRQAMTWLHTWFGLVLGFVLMVAFYFGTLAVFAPEFDRWAIPASRFAPQPLPSFDRVLRPLLERMQPTTEQLKDQVDEVARVAGPLPGRFEVVRYWDVYGSDRDPFLTLYGGYELPSVSGDPVVLYAMATVDPRDGSLRPDDELRIGSGLFYPLHFNLNIHWRDLGAWIVGLAALVMMVALVSGVVMHRKIFREFFTFRPKKAVSRSSLDLHNMTGVLALPFHFFLAFTGVLIFAGIYFPVTDSQLKGLHDRDEQIEATTMMLPEKRSGQAAPTASVDAMMDEARRRWAAQGSPDDVAWLTLHHVGDAAGRVTLHRAVFDRLAADSEGIRFHAVTGEWLREDAPPTAMASTQGFLVGLHRLPVRHALLRGLYLLGGLMGCVCIATGFIFFVEKRRKQHLARGSSGARIVDALAVTTVTGMVVASLTILVANRLTPSLLPGGGPAAASFQLGVFWTAWGLMMVHALVRSAAVARGGLNPAWREQAALICVLAPLAVVLNAWSTGDHLFKTLSSAYWPVAGIDSALLVTGGLAWVACRRLGRRMVRRASVPSRI